MELRRLTSRILGLLATVTVFTQSATALADFSNWAPHVRLVGVGAVAYAASTYGELGSPDYADAFWLWDGDRNSMGPSPNEHTWIRVRTECFTDSSRTGEHSLQYSEWANLADGSQHSLVFCPDEQPFVGARMVQVIADDLSEFDFDYENP